MTQLEEAHQLAKIIGSQYRPDKVILFGSTASKTNTAKSDIDLLVVKNTTKKRPFRTQEVFAVLRSHRRNYPLDVVVYTPKELENRLKLGDYFITNVLRYGQTLYSAK